MVFNRNLVVGSKKFNIDEDYEIDRSSNYVIGKGAYAEVRKAICKKTGFARAVKIINKYEFTKSEIVQIENEVYILLKLDHPNILKVYNFYEDLNHFYIVTELCTGGELFDKIIMNGYLDEQQAANVMKDILSAISYCHKYGIVHRDLKPENILFLTKKLDSPIKLIDFGTSSLISKKEKLNRCCGTPYYIAPEVLDGQYNEKCDIWSVGIMMYIMLCGYPPFNGINDKRITLAVLEANLEFPIEDWYFISSDAIDLIS